LVATEQLVKRAGNQELWGKLIFEANFIVHEALRIEINGCDRNIIKLIACLRQI
jgi:hypothetical protein